MDKCTDIKHYILLIIYYLAMEFQGLVKILMFYYIPFRRSGNNTDYKKGKPKVDFYASMGIHSCYTYNSWC